MVKFVSGRNCTPAAARTTTFPANIMIELQTEVFQHEHITLHKKDSQIAKAVQIVKALQRKRGLASILDKDTFERIVTVMTGEGFNPVQIRQTLTKQFTDEERIELYERISNDLSPAYGGTGKKISLADSVYCRHGVQGFSRLVKVWLNPPRKKKLPPTLRVTPEMVAAIELVNRVIPNIQPGAMISTIKPLQTYHQTTIAPWLAGLNISDGIKFTRWLKLFLDYAYNKSGQRMHLGFLKIDGPTFLSWDRDFKEETMFQSKRARAGNLRALAAEKLEAEEKERAFKEAYGL